MAEQDNRGPLGSIETVGMAALAVGAGAALLYRGGGSRLLSDGFKRATHALNETANSLSSNALRDYEGNRASLLYGNLRDAYRGADDRVSLRIDNSNSLLNTVALRHQMQNNPRGFLGQLYDDEVIRQPIKRDLQTAYGANDNLNQKITHFVDDTMRRQDEAFTYTDEAGLFNYTDEFKQKHFGDSSFNPQEQQAMMDRMIEAVRAKKDGGFEQFIQDRGRLVSEVTEKLDDVNELALKFGSRTRQTFGKTFKDSMLGDQQATVNDLLRNRDRVRNSQIPGLNAQGGFATNDIMDMLEENVRRDEAFGNLFIDKALRVNGDGQLYSFDGIAKVKDKVLDEFANTLPGRLFKARDIIETKKAPNVSYFGMGKADPILVALGEGRDSTLSSNGYVRILDKTFRINENQLEHVQALDNTYLMSGEHGTANRVMKYMSGDIDHRLPKENGVLRWLDAFSTPQPSKWKAFRSFLTKGDDERWARNMFDRFLQPNMGEIGRVSQDMNSIDGDLRGAAEGFIGDYFARIRKVDKFFSETTKQLDRATVAKLHSNTTGESQRIFNLLQQTDEQLIHQLMQRGAERFYNPTLKSLVKRYMKDSKSAVDTMSIVSDNIIMGNTRAVKYTEMLRKELGKEGLMAHSRQSGGDPHSLLELFEQAGIKGQSLKETKYLANWAVLQDVSGVNSASRGPKQIGQLKDNFVRTQTLFSGTDTNGGMAIRSEFLRSFQENVRLMSREKAPAIQQGFQRDDDIIPGNSFGKWMFMQKSIGPKTILANLNADTMKRAVSQLYAGRKNMNNVTTATMFPYFFVHRLMEPLDTLGLGFSARSTGSVGDYAMNVMLRRIMPIAGGLTALSYLDYTSKSLTGTSLKGAAANSIGNIDLFNHRLMDSMGMTGFMKDQFALNPMAQYWQEQEPMSYDERKKWYEDGYSPVRKGRWWSFGSASEFRGGKIDYYQPNYVRRANSDWYDISVYGSVSEKWAHSWIPTPQHPLAPLRRLVDPYWLENKHYYDRPYPVTGKMFEEGTPWGSILNPTVGEILKPVRRMHGNELGGTLTDVRDLIAQRNAQTKDRANDRLVRVEGNTFTPVSYAPLGQPGDGSNIVTAQVRNGSISGGILGGNYSAMDMNEYSAYHDALQQRAVAASQNGSYQGDSIDGQLSFGTRVRLAADQGGVVAGVLDKALPMNLIAAVNQGTRQRAAGAPMLRSKGGDGGVIVNDAIFNTKASNVNPLLDDGDVMADLRNVGTTKEMLQDAAYSVKELGGMYGFMFESLMPGDKKYALQNAGRMDSFSRKFWDASVGGSGGEFMEIARRFFPHEDHSVERINPIRNTMPGWMPERFRHGDPYEQLPKGEMRLPGEGYEDIYDLHPDMYGNYGAFDRMKILGDIAPWSREYRQWRDIAQKTIKDPALKEQMKAIKERVKEQSKQHDFYPYKFLGQKLEEHKVVIDQVDGKGFTIVGDNQRFKMAGIKLTEGNRLQDVLQPGMTVRIKHDANPVPGNSVSAIVLNEEGNLNRKLYKEGRAEATNDPTVAGSQARFTANQVDRGRVLEALAHAPIPYLHNKFMRVNTPLESYKHEQVYGSKFATWNHPIEGFIIPAFQSTFAQGPLAMTLGAASWMIDERVGRSGAGLAAKAASRTAFLLTNPGGFAGSMIGFLAKINAGPYMKAGGRIGAAVGLAGTMLTQSSNPIYGTIEGSIVGMGIANIVKKGSGRQGALLGAVAGLAVSAMKNPYFDKERMFGPYIPERIKKRWEVEEYYDRLKYIKYTGLYEKAADKAKRKEGVNIRAIVNKHEKDAEEREKIKRQLLARRTEVSNTYAEGDSRRADILAEIDEKMQALSYPQTIVKAGEYTKSALAYKQAAESTVYGLKKNASWSQILRAVPKYERDYMLEFSKERDPEKQKEILKYIAPYRRRVLELAWGQTPSKVEDNAKFFSNHKLPGLFWSGWQPGVDMDNVEMKTIKNEGMLLSDFGFYESQAQTPEAQAAPSIDMHDDTGPIELRKNLMTALSGAGLIGVDVSVEPSSQPGLQVMANIMRIGDYQVKEKMNDMLGRLFY